MENIYSVVENLLGHDYITVPIEHIDKNGGHGNTLSVKIVLPTWCQANCEFCFNKVNKDLQVHNLEEFKKNLDNSLHIIQNSMTDRKITLDITGNEPTFNPVFLKEVLDIISKYKTDIVDKIVITSNGYHLLDFENLYPIDIVNISLHHYDFQKRKDIFRTSLIPNDDELKILCQRFNTTAIAVCDETDIDFEKFIYNFTEYAKNIGFKNVRIRTNYLTDGTIFYNSFKNVHIDSHVGLDKKILDINGFNVNLYRGIKELTSCVIGPEIVIDDNGLIYLDYYKKYQLSGDDIRVFNNCIFVKK